jgi:hypothetical protein
MGKFVESLTSTSIEEFLSRILYILIFRRLDYTYFLGYDIGARGYNGATLAHDCRLSDVFAFVTQLMKAKGV